MAKSDESDAETYSVARFAEWAGDFEYSRSLYSQVGEGSQSGFFPDRFEHLTPNDYIRFVSQLRAARLGKPVSEKMLGMAKEVFGEDQATKPLEAPKPLILKPTTHLRGVVHRVGSHDFEMRAYLSSTDFEHRLYRNANRLARGPGLPAYSIEHIGRRQYLGPPGPWAIEGTLFQQVTVSYFGLIKSDARWTRIELPRDAQSVLEPFQSLLDSLDP